MILTLYKIVVYAKIVIVSVICPPGQFGSTSPSLFGRRKSNIGFDATVAISPVGIKLLDTGV